MIVRIATEGQYEIGEGDKAELSKLDNDAATACEAVDEAHFQEAFERLLAFIREHGKQVSDDQLVGSDMIIPPPDVSFEEARAEFHGEGLIPG